MDQIKVDVIDTEASQRDVEALLDTVMKGTPDLTRDLQKK